MKHIILDRGLSVDIQVDGGVNLSNAKEILEAGADILVAGTAVFAGDSVSNVESFKEIMENLR